MSLRPSIFALLLLAVFRPTNVAALVPENLLLLTNRNVPESRKLADYYAEKRKVPAGRILELDLPAGAEEIAYADYETKVVPAVREFLTKHKLREQVTCLVPFYGLPLRIANRVNTPADEAELAGLRQQLAAGTDAVARAVEALEAIAREVEPAFKTAPDRTLNGLAVRDRIARGVISQHAMKMNDPAQFEAFMERSERAAAPIDGDAQRAERRMNSLARAGEQMTPEQRKEVQATRQRLLQMRAKFDELQARRADPAAREELRNLVREQLGGMEYARLVEGMVDYFSTDGVAAALDSELALVDWNYYPRRGALPNPLHYKTSVARGAPPTYMVMRLDAPQAGIVQMMILASLKAEAEGLTGKVVIDAGGNLSIDPKNQAYAAFDQTLRNLGEIVRTKTTLRLVLDTKREVLPAESDIKDVAIYCGWYALRNYTAAFTFTPGAVGYHVASFELTSLRRPGNREWVAGLLTDGIAATVGAVAEPYLSAFPPPDEFFPLLLTGRLTLAETYWKTCPNVSWMISFIGDPLYTPFKSKPAIELEALPGGLQAAARATPPATPPPATQGVR